NVIIGVILLSLLVRTEGIQFRSVWLSLAPPAIGSGAGTLAILLLRVFLPFQNQIAAYLALAGVAFLATYILTVRVLFRSSVIELLEYVPGGRYLAKQLLLG